MLNPREEIPTLPLSDRLTDEAKANNVAPEHILNETHYREFLESVLEHGLYALSLFHELRDKYKQET